MSRNAWLCSRPASRFVAVAALAVCFMSAGCQQEPDVGLTAQLNDVEPAQTVSDGDESPVPPGPDSHDVPDTFDLAHWPYELFDKFVNSPSVEAFDAMVEAGRHDETYRIFYYYEQYSRLMTPSHNFKLDIPVEDLRKAFAERDEAAWSMLARAMILHPNGWRQWTMAVTIGDYGPYECKPQMELLAEKIYAGGRPSVLGAIKDLEKRHSGGK